MPLHHILSDDHGDPDEEDPLLRGRVLGRHDGRLQRIAAGQRETAGDRDFRRGLFCHESPGRYGGVQVDEPEGGEISQLLCQGLLCVLPDKALRPVPRLQLQLVRLHDVQRPAAGQPRHQSGQVRRGDPELFCRRPPVRVRLLPEDQEDQAHPAPAGHVRQASHLLLLLSGILRRTTEHGQNTAPRAR